MTAATWADVLLLIARLGAGVFAGSCLYIAIAQQPARMTLGAAEALREFRATIPRAERIQPASNIVPLLAAALAAVLRFDVAVALAALLLLVALVVTVATVLPINRLLTSGSVEEHLGRSDALLTRWGALHRLRTGLAVVAAVLLLLPGG